MPSFNKTILCGNLTRDIELKSTPQGTQVCDVGLAVNDKRKQADGSWIEDVLFVEVVMWGRTAEVAAEYLTKGSAVLIEGKLKLDQWEKDGEKRSKIKVVCDRMQMLGRGDGSQASDQAAPAAGDTYKNPNARRPHELESDYSPF